MRRVRVLFFKYMNRRGIPALILTLVAGFCMAQPANAQQFGLEQLRAFSSSMAPLPEFGQVAPGVGGLFENESLIATPSYPGPFETFDLELSAPDASYSGARIRWYIDGEEDVSARDKRQHSLTTGAIGETMRIRITLEKQNGATTEITRTIVPTQLDIVLESFSTIPEFYAGRALPAQSTLARAVATINTGSSLDRDNLTYEWRLNTTRLEAGAIRGLRAVNFEVPLGAESYLEVTVSDRNGVLAKRGIEFRPAQPEILFYEENPLFGVSPFALGEQTTFIGNQVTVRAEPYYMNPAYTDPQNLVEWNLGGQRIDTSGQPERNVVTIQGNGTNSGGNVSLRLADLTRLSLPVQDGFYLKFGF